MNREPHEAQRTPRHWTPATRRQEPPVVGETGRGDPPWTVHQVNNAQAVIDADFAEATLGLQLGAGCGLGFLKRLSSSRERVHPVEGDAALRAIWPPSPGEMRLQQAMVRKADA